MKDAKYFFFIVKSDILCSIVYSSERFFMQSTGQVRSCFRKKSFHIHECPFQTTTTKKVRSTREWCPL